MTQRIKKFQTIQERDRLAQAIDISFGYPRRGVDGNRNPVGPERPPKIGEDLAGWTFTAVIKEEVDGSPAIVAKISVFEAVDQREVEIDRERVLIDLSDYEEIVPEVDRGPLEKPADERTRRFWERVTSIFKRKP